MNIFQTLQNDGFLRDFQMWLWERVYVVTRRPYCKVKTWEPSPLTAGSYPQGALRLEEKKGRKLHKPLQASSTPAECDLRWRKATQLGPGTHLKLPGEADAPTASWTASYSVASAPLFLPRLVPDAYAHPHWDPPTKGTGLSWIWKIWTKDSTARKQPKAEKSKCENDNI